MVVMKLVVKLSSEKRSNKHDLPTPDTTKTMHEKQKHVRQQHVVSDNSSGSKRSQGTVGIRPTHTGSRATRDRSAHATRNKHTGSAALRPANEGEAHSTVTHPHVCRCPRLLLSSAGLG
jgi:hypothetical protein